MKKVKNQATIPYVKDFIHLIRQQSVRQTSHRLDHETFLRAFKGKETPDAELIEDYTLNHNEQAFDELYRRHKQNMLAYLYGILHNWEDAKDVLHNAWEAILQSFNNNCYREEQDFAGWFKGICYHRASEWLRDKRRFIYGNEQMPDHADNSINVEQQLDNRQREALLQKAFKLLTDREQQVVNLRIMEGKSFIEIADIMNINEKSAGGMYSRALKKLKND